MKANFRAGGGETEDEASDEEPAFKRPASRTGRAKAAAKAKGKAKAKAKAKTGKAKAKTGKATSKSKASPKKRPSKRSNRKKSDDETPSKKVKGDETPSKKIKKVKPDGTPGKKVKPDGTTGTKVKPDGTPGKTVKRTGISKKTFAGRCVKGPELLAMRDIFEEKIYFMLRSHASLQHSFFKMVTSAFSKARTEQKELDYKMCVEIVNEHVEEFLKLDDVRPSMQQLSLAKLNAFKFLV